MRSVILAATLMTALTAGAHAQSCDAEPEFAAQRAANTKIRAQFNYVSRGDWREAIHFGREVADSGASSGTKAAALTNLCIAYGATGEYALAVEACTEALDYRPENWRALNNRGAVHFLAGDTAAANADFAAAAALAGDEDEIVANQALAQCAV